MGNYTTGKNGSVNFTDLNNVPGQNVAAYLLDI